MVNVIIQEMLVACQNNNTNNINWPFGPLKGRLGGSARNVNEAKND